MLASANKGKLTEIQAMLEGSGIELRPLSEFDIVGGRRNRAHFVENAIIKARAACVASGMPAIADDSGLEVDALGGEPGVHSARFAGIHGDDQANNELLLERLARVPDPGAPAVSAASSSVSPMLPIPAPLICEGVWEGRIADHPRGGGGFGYDPLFVPRGISMTSAELSPAREEPSEPPGSGATQTDRTADPCLSA